MSGRAALAASIESKSRREAARSQRIRRASVIGVKPLTVRMFNYAYPLSIDNDFEMSQWAKFYDRKVGIRVDDVVLMHEESGSWVLHDIVSDTSITGM